MKGFRLKMDKEKRVEDKFNELRRLFETLPQNKLKAAEDLIKQAAFLAVTLDDLSYTMSVDGVVEEYTNGEHQKGRKLSSEAKLYSSLIAKYTAIVEKLLKMIPVEKLPETVSTDKADSYGKEALEKARQAAEAQSEEKERLEAFFSAVAAGLIRQEDYRAFMDGELEL